MGGVGTNIIVEWVTSSLVICQQLVFAYQCVIFYKYAMPQPRAARRLGKQALFKSQSKCIIMNVDNSVSKYNPTMTVRNLKCMQIYEDMCGISVHSLQKLVTESNKLGPDEPFTKP